MSQLSRLLMFVLLPVATAWHCGYEGYMCCRGAAKCRCSNLECTGATQNKPGACFRRNSCGLEGKRCCSSFRSPIPVVNFCSNGLECESSGGLYVCRKVGILIGGRRFFPGMSITQLPTGGDAPAFTSTTTALTGSGTAKIGSGTAFNEAVGSVETSKENGGSMGILSSQRAGATGFGPAGGALRLGAFGNIQSRGRAGGLSARHSTSAAEGSLTFTASGAGENHGSGLQHVNVDSDRLKTTTKYLGSTQVQGSGPLATGTQFSLGQSNSW